MDPEKLLSAAWKYVRFADNSWEEGKVPVKLLFDTRSEMTLCSVVIQLTLPWKRLLLMSKYAALGGACTSPVNKLFINRTTVKLVSFAKPIGILPVNWFWSSDK